MRLQARLDARDRLRESEKALSQNIYERGVDNPGLGRIRAQGDAALFGGHTTQMMKDKYGIVQTRPLADFLPTLTIAAKNLATEMTNHNVQQANLLGERATNRLPLPWIHGGAAMIFALLGVTVLMGATVPG